MNYIDILLLLPLAYGLIRGIMRGLVKEVASLLALFTGIMLAYFYADEVSLWLAGWISARELWLHVFAYVLIFLTVGLVFYILSSFITKMLSFLALGLLNRLLGGLFGFAKTLLILLLLVSLFKPYLQQVKENSEKLQQSKVYPYLEDYSHLSGQLLNRFVPEQNEEPDSTFADRASL